MTTEHEREALRLDPNGYTVQRGHTLASAIAACVAPLASTTPEHVSGLAEESLRALGADLYMLHYAVEESFAGKGHASLNDEDIVEWIYRLARRAEGAADLCTRIASANAPTPVPRTDGAK